MHACLSVLIVHTHILIIPAYIYTKRYFCLQHTLHSFMQKPVREDCSQLEPWTQLAQQKLEVERELANTTNLDYVVVRPALVYGPGDKSSLSKYAAFFLLTRGLTVYSVRFMNQFSCFCFFSQSCINILKYIRYLDQLLILRLWFT